MMIHCSSLVFFSFAYFQVAFAFVHPSLSDTRPRFSIAARARGPKGPESAPDALTKASWYAVEAFGKIFGSPRKDTSAAQTYETDQPPASIKETQDRLLIDNEREYFLSGVIDELIYSEDCTFADPFVSFKGRDRFVENLANLGSFITVYSAKPLTYTVEENTVKTKFMVKLQLNLPWRPVLAWPWGVRCEIDPDTNLIVLHEESVSCNIFTAITSFSNARDHPPLQWFASSLLTLTCGFAAHTVGH
jgi:Uncharacterized conserved protein (DUF2358)